MHEYRNVFRYYGGKFNQIKDILSIMHEYISSFDVVIEVFGGSGKLLLNLPDGWKKMKVYNDIDKDLYITFKVLQDPEKRAQLSSRLELAFAHSDIFTELKNSVPDNDVDTAFRLIYLQTYSFAADGETFGRKFKGHKLDRFRIEDFVYVRDWVIENMDFRKLMARYNKPRVFFYLDPPYLSSGKKYKYSFTLGDMVDLKKAIDEHHGSYLLNLSLYDTEVTDIFGRPNKVINYANPVTHQEAWSCGYWWRFALSDANDMATSQRRQPDLYSFDGGQSKI
ncbi:MAG: DNA adenine methylase [Candidatus Bathyarchaeia archaeon]